MHRHEIINLRPTTDFVEKFQSEGYVLLPKEERSKLSEDIDPNDMELFVAARAKFVASLRRYGLVVPAELEEYAAAE